MPGLISLTYHNLLTQRKTHLVKGSMHHTHDVSCILYHTYGRWVLFLTILHHKLSGTKAAIFDTSDCLLLLFSLRISTGCVCCMVGCCAWYGGSEVLSAAWSPVGPCVVQLTCTCTYSMQSQSSTAQWQVTRVPSDRACSVHLQGSVLVHNRFKPPIINNLRGAVRYDGVLYSQLVTTVSGRSGQVYLPLLVWGKREKRKKRRKLD